MHHSERFLQRSYGTAVVVEDEDGEAITVRPIGILAQSFDHRAMGGAYSAAFLGRLKQIVETYDWAAELR